MAVIPENQALIFKEAGAKLNTILKPEEQEDVRLVQKGLMLYHQGAVHHLKYMVNSIWATVQDVTPVRVFLNVDDPQESSCTCPSGSFCRHRLAAFFQAYSDVASVSDWVANWRQPAIEQINAEKWGLKRAKDLVKNNQHPGLDYDRWVDFFQENFAEIVLAQGKPHAHFVSGLFRPYAMRMENYAPVEAGWRPLYLLAATLHSFRLLTDLAVDAGHDQEATIKRYYWPLFEDLYHDAEKLIERIASGTMPFSFDAVLERLKDDSVHLTVPAIPLSYERIDLYRLLWDKLFRDNAWRKAELARLEAFGDGKRDEIEEVALIHQLLLSKQDGDAIKRFTALPVRSLPYLFYWLDGFHAQREWNRMAPFIEYLVQQLRNYLLHLGDYYSCKKFTQYALNLIRTFTRELGRGELYDRALAQSMPYSFYQYEQTLFEKKHYQQWSELQSYFGFEDYGISGEQLKILQKEAPEVLLPLYHQMAADLIEMKNRTSYKQAVRILKKLRTVYKKLKRTPEWEAFFAKLLVKTKRLRAFHEECKRSKLIQE